MQMLDFKYGLDFKDISISDLTYIVLLQFPVMPPVLALKYRDRDQYFHLLTCLLINIFSNRGDEASDLQFQPFVAVVNSQQVDNIATATYTLQFQILMAIYFFQCQHGRSGEDHLSKAADIVRKYWQRIRSGAFQMAHIALFYVYNQYSVDFPEELIFLRENKDGSLHYRPHKLFGTLPPQYVCILTNTIEKIRTRNRLELQRRMILNSQNKHLSFKYVMLQKGEVRHTRANSTVIPERDIDIMPQKRVYPEGNIYNINNVSRLAMRLALFELY